MSAMEDLFKPSVNDFEKRDVKGTINGMKQHRNHNGVQLDGIKRLATLTQIELNCEKFLEEDGDKELIIAIQTFAADPQLLMYACCVMGNVYLQINAKSSVEREIAHKCIGTVLTVMKAHPSNQGVQCYGLHALCGLALNSNSNSKFIVEKEGLEQIHTSMKSHKDDYLLTNALSTLYNIATAYEESKELMNNKSFLELIKLAATAFPGDEELQQAAVNILHILDTGT